jgi:NO-binding membrane sensor protein with MHYT domain
MVLVYLVGGAAAGAVAGLLAPLARWRLGGVVVGVVAALPFGGMMAYAKSGLPPWRDPGADSSVIVVALLGALVGWAFPPRAREIEARAARK